MAESKYQRRKASREKVRRVGQFDIQDESLIRIYDDLPEDQKASLNAYAEQTKDSADMENLMKQFDTANKSTALKGMQEKFKQRALPQEGTGGFIEPEVMEQPSKRRTAAEASKGTSSKETFNVPPTKAPPPPPTKSPALLKAAAPEEKSIADTALSAVEKSGRPGRALVGGLAAVAGLGYAGKKVSDAASEQSANVDDEGLTASQRSQIGTMRASGMASSTEIENQKRRFVEENNQPSALSRLGSKLASNWKSQMLPPSKKEEENKKAPSASEPKSESSKEISSTTSSTSSVGSEKEKIPAAPMKERQAKLDAVAKDLPSPLLANFNDERMRLEELRVRAVNAYKKDKESADWGRVAEMLGRAMLKLAAGYSGLKSGHDMSGAVESGEKWDWKSDYDNMKDTLKFELEGIESNKADLGRREAAINKEASDERSDKRDYKKAIDVANIAHKNDQARIDAKATEDKLKDDRYFKKLSVEDMQSQIKSFDKLANVHTSKGGKITYGEISDLDLETLPTGAKEWWGLSTSDKNVDIADLTKRISEKKRSMQRELERRIATTSDTEKETSDQRPSRAAPSSSQIPAGIKDGDVMTKDGIRYKRVGGLWKPLI